MRELEGLLIKMLQREGIQFDRKVVAEFVTAEFAKADTDGSGDVDFDEFIAYYNSLVDRISGGAMNDALEQARKATAKKLEELINDGLLGVMRLEVSTWGGVHLDDDLQLTCPNKLKAQVCATHCLCLMLDA